MKRNYSIDLCRIVVLFMVVTHHILSHGGVMNVLTPGTVNYNIAYLLNVMVRKR